MEKEIALFILIIFSICFVSFWVFLLTWQQIGFLKKDVARLQEKNEERREETRKLEREVDSLQREVISIDRNIKYKRD